MNRNKLRRFFPRRALLARALLIGVPVVALISAVTKLYTEALWFESIDRADVHSKMLTTKLALGLVGGIFVFAAILITIVVAKRLTPQDRAFKLPAQALERSRQMFSSSIRRGPMLVAAVAGLLAGLQLRSHWREFLLWQNGTSFGTAEEVFGKDIGTYVFDLPWWRSVQGFLSSTALWLVVITVVAHYLFGGIRPQNRGQRITRAAARHISFVVGIWLAVTAWRVYLERLDYVVDGRGVVSGAGYTDLLVGIPMLRALATILLVAAMAAVLHAMSPRRKLATTMAAILGATALASLAIPVGVQRLAVRPDEAAREAPYLARSLEATRAAYGLESIERIPLSVPDEPEPGSLAGLAGGIERLPIWSPQVVQQVAGSIQRFTPFYAFPSRADIDVYEIDGELRQVLTGAREVTTQGLTGTAKTWSNAHLFYTHGEGAVVALADDAKKGLPSFLLGGVPPKAKHPEVNLEETDVVIGEMHGPAFVLHEAPTGVEMNNLVRRAAFAWRFGDLNLLISGAVGDDARLMFHRNVWERASHVAPFLTLDRDPYPTIVGGRLLWVVDGYTTSSHYPYSIPTDFNAASKGLAKGHGNYIRNAAKVIVDASDGSVTVYAFDEADPIMSAWREVFPDAIRPRSEIPAELAMHLRIPQALYAIMTERYASVHVDDAKTFYQADDAWQVARDPVGCLNGVEPTVAKLLPSSGEQACHRSVMVPRYLLANVQGKDRFLVTRSFTPAGQGRANLVAYMAADALTGELFVFELPTSTRVLGPEQAQASINQDPSVSQQVSLWNQQHSKVIYGDLISAPIGNSFVYIQSLYLQAEGSDLPQLKRVVLLIDGQVAMGNTVADALSKLMGGSADLDELLDDQRKRAQRCLTDGDEQCALQALQRYEELFQGRDEASS